MSDISGNSSQLGSTKQLMNLIIVSIDHCISTEIISYYTFNGSNVYTVLLNAFDRVNYCKLFRKLLDRNMSPLVLRLLLYIYTNQSLQVRWGSHTSTRFNVQNGMKQGVKFCPIFVLSIWMVCLHK